MATAWHNNGKPHSVHRDQTGAATTWAGFTPPTGTISVIVKNNSTTEDLWVADPSHNDGATINAADDYNILGPGGSLTLPWAGAEPGTPNPALLLLGSDAANVPFTATALYVGV